LSPLFGGFLRAHQVKRAIDQGHVGESLREVTNLPPGAWIVLFAEQPNIIAQF
jgi:hypothetical protein